MSEVTISEQLLNDVKSAIPIRASGRDGDIRDLIKAAWADLGIAGVIPPAITDPLIKQAVKTYVKAHFGRPANYEQLAASYDEQKAQLQMATGYTDWRDADAGV